MVLDIHLNEFNFSHPDKIGDDVKIFYFIRWDQRYSCYLGIQILMNWFKIREKRWKSLMSIIFSGIVRVNIRTKNMETPSEIVESNTWTEHGESFCVDCLWKNAKNDRIDATLICMRSCLEQQQIQFLIHCLACTGKCKMEQVINYERW